MRVQEAMEPEAVASGFVAGDDLGVRGEPEPRLGGEDLGQEPLQVAGRDGPELGLLPCTDGQGEPPGVPAEFQR